VERSVSLILHLPFPINTQLWLIPASLNRMAKKNYGSRELVPADLVEDVKRAKIVITNYHAFKLCERIELPMWWLPPGSEGFTQPCGIGPVSMLILARTWPWKCANITGRIFPTGKTTMSLKPSLPSCKKPSRTKPPATGNGGSTSGAGDSPNVTRISPWNIRKYHWLPTVRGNFCQPFLPQAQRDVIPQPSPADDCH